MIILEQILTAPGFDVESHKRSTLHKKRNIYTYMLLSWNIEVQADNNIYQ